MKRKQGSNTTPYPEAKRTAAPTVEALQELLDFSQGVETKEDIEPRFKAIAKSLLHEFHLVAVTEDTTKEIEFEILEAEFYLQIAGHEDPFTHGSEEQKLSGNWHFHRAPRKSIDSHRSSTSLTGYRGGTRKGLDLTIGGTTTTPPVVLSRHFLPAPPISNSPETLGGILLRSLRELGPNGKIISGPSLFVDHIINISGASNIADLVEHKWEGDTCAFISGQKDSKRSTKLFLRPASSTSSRPIYFSPRIGLDLSHPGTTNPTILPLHPRIQFLPKFYRFFTHPEMLVSNGRPQTFLGVLLSLSISTSYSDITETLKKPLLSQEIAALMALKEPTSAKYLAEYVAGLEGGIDTLNLFVGSKGKGASSSPSSYLRMMGALSNLISPL